LRQWKLLIIAATDLISVTSLARPQDRPDIQNRWVPDLDTVDKIDALALQFKMPKGSLPISIYARYYWGDVEDGRRVIYAHLMSPAWDGFRAGKGEIIIVAASGAVPELGDGGCDEVNVAYDVAADKVTSIQCNPELLPPPPH
jgi:hypothetical protein